MISQAASNGQAVRTAIRTTRRPSTASF
jgi:hypothetical protein